LKSFIYNRTKNRTSTIVDYASFYSATPLVLTCQKYPLLVLIMRYSNLLLKFLKPLQYFLMSYQISHEPYKYKSKNVW